ncbi:uncharacterized protein L201_001964 [Kwoniella dendrophila CBS 6074]|uniref:Altered inheritance of mitochondria protein 23, mitochondrial n=1 Tax=Kwoniella dendrophila CBS 6074 TaxID=1295534 RepID=A0AAX4JQC5_9TREE
MGSKFINLTRTAIASTSRLPITPARAPLLPSFSVRQTRQASSSTFGLRAPPPEAHPLSYKDSSIPYKTVQLVDPETNHLLEPQSLRSILNSYDQSTHTLILVNLGNPNDKQSIPIVKLINKIEERKKERNSEEKSKLKKKLNLNEKEIQISWQSELGDLKNKLNLSKNILEKGESKLQIIFANRKKSENVSESKKQDIIKMFNDELIDHFGKKSKDDEKNLKNGLYTLHFIPLDNVRNEIQSKIKDQQSIKQLEKQQKKEERRKKEEERRLKADAKFAAEQAKET